MYAFCSRLGSDMPDKYAATWISHSSLSDFLACPQAYFYKNVYKDRSTGKKIQIVTPALSLGSAIHEVLEALSVLPVDKRFTTPLVERFARVWPKYHGKKGGFFTQQQEENHKQQGEEMLRKVSENPGPLAQLAVKIQDDLPQYWLSEEDEIILCGKIDWLQYDQETDSVHIIDFKTSKKEVQHNSLQLPIYRLLVTNTQKRSVSGMSYWYVRFADTPTEQDLPDLQESFELVLAEAKKVRLARKLQRFVCPQGSAGCMHCRPFERIVAGGGEQVGVSQYGQLVFVLPNATETGGAESIVL